jgi:mono/diheme cytochrome c family protein
MNTRLLSAVIAASLAAAVHADPFPNADPNLGRKYFEQGKCGACHDSLMGGDGNRIFTRPDRGIEDPRGLAKMVRFCVSQTGAPVFPEDIEHIAAYLNRHFYKFN